MTMTESKRFKQEIEKGNTEIEFRTACGITTISFQINLFIKHWKYNLLC